MTIAKLTEEEVDEIMKPLTQAKYDSYDYTSYYSNEETAPEDDGRGDEHGNFY